MSRSSGLQATNTKKRARTNKEYASALATVLDGMQGTAMASSYGPRMAVASRKLSGELGCLDTPLSTMTPAYATNVPTVADGAAPPCLNAMNRGNAVYQREGKQIHLKSLQYRLCFEPCDQATGPHIIRIVVVGDGGNNGFQPTWQNVMANQIKTGAISSPIFAFPNTDFTQRFKILADECISMAGGTDLDDPALSNDTSVRVVERYIKLRNALTTYGNGDDGTFTDINTGALWMFILQDCAAGSGSRVTGNFRLRFIDPK